jgi:pyridoxine kinase
MAILSIQSHVAYGYVGNKAATFPLQSMGFDVWPVNTVQFSNHTGYGKWGGTIFGREHLKEVIEGIEGLGVVGKCRAILSGYMGNSDICQEVYETVRRFKKRNSGIIYLCDPVIGNTSCFVKPEVLEFFKNNLCADIITPNQFEAETFSGITIKNLASLKRSADYFHKLNIRVVIITGIKTEEISPRDTSIFISYNNNYHIIKTKEYPFAIPPNGTGDLFSALYLGNYLATNNEIESLKRAVYFMDLVVKNTSKAGSRELLITSVNYGKIDESSMPEAIRL